VVRYGKGGLSRSGGKCEVKTQQRGISRASHGATLLIFLRRLIVATVMGLRQMLIVPKVIGEIFFSLKNNNLTFNLTAWKSTVQSTHGNAVA
jgi:uncharacterized protein YqhQ